MKKLIATTALLLTATAFAGSTTSVVVRGSSSADVEMKLRQKVQRINRSNQYLGCENPRVYGASAPSMSYRVNRFGELQEKWTATIKVRCRNDD